MTVSINLTFKNFVSTIKSFFPVIPTLVAELVFHLLSFTASSSWWLRCHPSRKHFSNIVIIAGQDSNILDIETYKNKSSSSTYFMLTPQEVLYTALVNNVTTSLHTALVTMGPHCCSTMMKGILHFHPHRPCSRVYGGWEARIYPLSRVPTAFSNDHLVTRRKLTLLMRPRPRISFCDVSAEQRSFTPQPQRQVQSSFNCTFLF